MHLLFAFNPIRPILPGDVSDVARPVQLAPDDVVHHATRVANPETTRLDPAHRGRTNDGDVLGVGRLDQVPGHVFRNPLGNDGDGLDLRVV